MKLVVDEQAFDRIGRSTFTVILTDERGNEWSCADAMEQMLVDGDGFGDPKR